jgi:acyl carrier protein
MNKKLLLNDLAKIIEVEESTLTDDSRLSGHEYWDSLTMVSMIAAIDQHYKCDVSGLELEACETVENLFELIESKNNLVTKAA